uniref:Adhesion G protein-coupled receptor F3 n=1 Tax=Myotis myotis TaxID=51298 RepID=A0A7J7U3Z7_MYOMY|nr:adhesion G protein-coupled receptor F3 [Myotis myotis]
MARAGLVILVKRAELRPPRMHLLIASFASVKIGELRGGEREVKGHFPRGFAPRPRFWAAIAVARAA